MVVVQVLEHIATGQLYVCDVFLHEITNAIGPLTPVEAVHACRGDYYGDFDLAEAINNNSDQYRIVALG